MTGVTLARNKLAMQELEALLEHIAASTRYTIPQLRSLGTGTEISLQPNPTTTIPAARLRHTLQHAQWESEERIVAECAEPIVPPELMTALTRTVQHILAAYIANDSKVIRHMFPGYHSKHTYTVPVNSGVYQLVFESLIPEFCKSLVRASSLLGSASTVRYLRDWIGGQPLTYQCHALVGGLAATEKLDLGNGIRLWTLPKSSDRLTASLPRETGLSVTDYLGRTVISVDLFVKPVLSRAPYGDLVDLGPQVIYDPGIASMSSLAEALSLVCDQFIYYRLCWNDYGAISAFSGRQHKRFWKLGPDIPILAKSEGWTGSDATGVYELTDRDDGTRELSPEQLRLAWHLHTKLARRETTSSRFNTAVTRWMKAIRPDVDSTDRFIDLRIALEALFLDKPTTRTASRLAKSAATLFAAHDSEPAFSKSVVKRFYRRASEVVHGGSSSLHQQDRHLLDKARQICRLGILRTIDGELKH